MWTSVGEVQENTLEHFRSIFINQQDLLFTTHKNPTGMNGISLFSSINGSGIGPVSIPSLIPSAFFVSTLFDIYIHTSTNGYEIIRWSIQRMNGTVVMNTPDICYSLFVDQYNDLYCSLPALHQVIKHSLNSSNGTDLAVVAGNGTAGSSSDLLNYPKGVIVDSAINLYVADCLNDRVQRFPVNSSTATTVIGNGSNVEFELSCPMGLTMDKNGYLFIVDSQNNRVIGSGPNGFRCLFGCGGSVMGGVSLDSPSTLSFDSDGNIYKIESTGINIMKYEKKTTACCKIASISSLSLQNTSFFLDDSYYIPSLCTPAAWNSNAVTIAAINRRNASNATWNFFVDRSTFIYIIGVMNDSINKNFDGNITFPGEIVLNNRGQQSNLFPTHDGNVYYNNFNGSSYQVERWMISSNTSEVVLLTAESCAALFVDYLGSLYCSLENYHQVSRRFLNATNNLGATVAGTGAAGSAADSLSRPMGIFVTASLALYVADCGNDRIQKFLFNRTNATTVAGAGANDTIDLKCPSAVVLDPGDVLYISDSLNNRIIRRVGNTFRCIAGCSQTNGSAPNELAYPGALWFGYNGHLYVADRYNSRIQKFTYISQSCRKAKIDFFRLRNDFVASFLLP